MAGRGSRPAARRASTRRSTRWPPSAAGPEPPAAPRPLGPRSPPGAKRSSKSNAPIGGCRVGGQHADSPLRGDRRMTRRSSPGRGHRRRRRQLRRQRGVEGRRAGPPHRPLGGGRRQRPDGRPARRRLASSARYAGADASDEANNRRLLEELAGDAGPSAPRSSSATWPWPTRPGRSAPRAKPPVTAASSWRFAAVTASATILCSRSSNIIALSANWASRSSPVSATAPSDPTPPAATRRVANSRLELYDLELSS